jgi:predicted dehydrogenase
MLARERLDLVDICLPPHRHKDAVVAALEQRINCLVEKPLAMTTDDADTVIALAREKGVNLHVIHNYSVIPGVLKAKALVAKGVIGEVIGAHINHFVPFAPRHLDPEHWCHSLPGDYFSEVGPHLAMLLVELLGPVDAVQSVALKASSHPSVRLDELRVIAQTRQGLGAIAGSMNCPSRIFTLDIIGTEGAIHVNCDYQAVVRYGPLDGSMNAWARGAAGVRDIVARTTALAWTSANVFAGRYALEIMGHRYLIQRSLRSLLGQGTYPIDTSLAREAVRLLEMAFAQGRDDEGSEPA